MGHGLSRSASVPSLIVGGQDTGGTWRSDDDGETWVKSPDEGLRGFGMQGVLIDPEDPDRWYGVGEALFQTGADDSSPHSGVYLTTDGGRHWAQVYSEPLAHHQRAPSEIACDPTTGGAGRTLYATITRWDGSAVVVRSTDRGEAWSVRSTIPATAAGAGVRGRVDALFHHPGRSGVLLLCTQGGLFRSTDGAATWTRMSGAGGLPVGEVARADVNPANGDEIYCVVNASGAADDGGLWRTTDGGSRWSEVGTPPGFPASKVFVGFADGGGWQPVGARTLYLIGRGQQMQVSGNGGASWQAAGVEPQPGRGDTWDRQISDSANGGLRPEITARALPHPRVAGRALFHAKSHNFRTDDGGETCRYSGEGFSGEIAFVWASSVAFSDDPLRMAFGVTDAGFRMTDDGGRSFHVGLVRGYTEGGVALKNSVHSIAIHPTDPDQTVACAGFRTGPDGMRLFKSDVRFPQSYVHDRTTGNGAAGSDWTRVRDVDDKHVFLQWNRDTPTCVYSTNARSLSSGDRGSWVGYGAGFGGCRAVFPGDHDVCYGLSGSGSSWTLRRSDDRGDTHRVLASIGWGGILSADLGYMVLAIHPTDPAVFFTASASGDLARYDGTSGTWRTGYGLRSLHAAAHPGAPSPQVCSVALDPQDADVGYVGIESFGFHGVWRSRNIQAASPDWEDVTLDFPRINVGPRLVVHPLTGDLLAGTGGVGGVRVLAAPGRRSHPSLIGNWSVT
jgi:hypothetical protein